MMLNQVPQLLFFGGLLIVAIAMVVTLRGYAAMAVELHRQMRAIQSVSAVTIDCSMLVALEAIAPPQPATSRITGSWISSLRPDGARSGGLLVAA